MPVAEGLVRFLVLQSSCVGGRYNNKIPSPVKDKIKEISTSDM